MNDLDEATDPESTPSVLLVVGFPRGHSHQRAEMTVLVIDRATKRLAAHGAIYRTRASEVCAIVELGGDGRPVDGLAPDGLCSDEVGELRSFILMEAQSQAGFRPSVGWAHLPVEACDAPSALNLADRRLATSGTRSHLAQATG